MMHDNKLVLIKKKGNILRSEICSHGVSTATTEYRRLLYKQIIHIIYKQLQEMQYELK
jgi:hypothetical protein